MLTDKQKKELEAFKEVDLQCEVDLSKFSTMKLKACGNILLIRTKEALKKVLPFLYQEKIPYQVLGWGANTILPEKVNKLLIRLDFPWNKNVFSCDKKSFILPASFPLNQLTSIARKYQFKGWEVFTGIPASLGGAVFMNAGTSLGEIGSLIKKVWVITPEGKEEQYDINEQSFSYRKNHFLKKGEVITDIELTYFDIDPEVSKVIVDYLKKRTETQPLNEKTCGCMFKNMKGKIPTGQGIDELGLKGLQVGDLRVSPIHGNFMENLGAATEKDVRELVKIIQDKFEARYGFRPELEVKID